MQIRQKLHQNGLINWTNEIGNVPRGNENFTNCKLPHMVNKYVDDTRKNNWSATRLRFSQDKDPTITNSIFKGKGYKILKQK